MWIRLKNIPVFAFHGVYAHEKEHGTRFEVDVDVRTERDQNIIHDSLERTVDYVKLHRIVTTHAHAERYNLLETWADRMCNQVMSDFEQIDEVAIRIRKPGAAIGGLLDTVEIECSKTR